MGPDRLAAERDIAPGRVLPDLAIVEAAREGVAGIRYGAGRHANIATGSMQFDGVVIKAGETFSFAGTRYALTDSPGLPKPVQSPRPPVSVSRTDTSASASSASSWARYRLRLAA